MIMHFNRVSLADNLPDAYCKADGSNIRKLLEINQGSMQRLRDNLRAIADSHGLDTATGKTLDLYGAMVGQERGLATDEQYRALIKTRIIRNKANGDFNSIIHLLSLVFSCDPAEISLSEPEDKPCTVKLDSLPFASLNRMAIDITTACKIIMEVMPAGVRMEAANFTGTFEFSDGTELVYDESAGFGDIEQTIGGYLGYVFDSNAPTLPV